MTAQFAHILLQDGKFVTWFSNEMPKEHTKEWWKKWHQLFREGNDEGGSKMKEWQKKQGEIILFDKIKRFLGQQAAEQLTLHGDWENYQLIYCGETAIRGPGSP